MFVVYSFGAGDGLSFNLIPFDVVVVVVFVDVVSQVRTKTANDNEGTALEGACILFFARIG